MAPGACARAASHRRPTLAHPQALMGGSSFCHALHTLRVAMPILDKSQMPTLAAFSELAAEFSVHEKPAPAAAAAAAPGLSLLTKPAAAGHPVAKAPGKPSSKGAATLILGGRPIMPSMLMDVATRFSPQRHEFSSVSASNASAATQGKPLTMAQRLAQGSGVTSSQVRRSGRSTLAARPAVAWPSAARGARSAAPWRRHKHQQDGWSRPPHRAEAARLVARSTSRRTHRSF